MKIKLKRFKISYCLGLVCSSLVSATVWAAPASVAQSAVVQRFDIEKPEGSVLGVMPEGEGPFPVAFVEEHGASASGLAHMMWQPYSLLSAYFLSRGYAVVHVKGVFGKEKNLPPCALAARARDDIQAEVEFVQHTLSTNPKLNTNALVVAGAGQAGLTALAASSVPVQGVKAVMAFSPTSQKSICKEDLPKNFIAAAAELGKQVAIPAFYAEGLAGNLMDEKEWHSMVTAYAAHNKNVFFVDMSRTPQGLYPFLSYADGFSYWSEKADGFLKKSGLPVTVKKVYLPPALDNPHATPFASLDDVNALPDQRNGARAAYEGFLKKPKPRAFFLSDNGTFSASGQEDIVRTGQKKCEEGKRNCKLYAYNTTVVWRGALRGETKVLSVNIGQGHTFQMFSADIKPDCSINFVPKIKVVRDALHGVVKVSEQTQPASSVEKKSGKACETPVKGTVFFYQATPGFTGTDSVMIERQINADAQHPETVIFNITIK
ncbi:hypothetical protein HK14_02605 [Acetobacter cibinongensis]|uniref:Dienelactone hydrolase domain-containing protein n=2 Tax=Acetobacter cibinongensis TaxID=146475 RepID=A0A1Z5YWG0_9PROT|nr:hypothetical protein HK14_02605 [Acetobacter cibinongensis]